MPSLRAYNELAEVLGCEKQKKPNPPPKKKRNPITFTFVIGHCYRIYSTGCYGSRKSHDALLSLSWERDCVFRYEGKEGIHHCFREVSGGWSRTYTDIQLMGKKIEEVKA